MVCWSRKAAWSHMLASGAKICSCKRTFFRRKTLPRVLIYTKNCLISEAQIQIFRLIEQKIPLLNRAKSVSQILAWLAKKLYRFCVPRQHFLSSFSSPCTQISICLRAQNSPQDANLMPWTTRKTDVRKEKQPKIFPFPSDVAAFSSFFGLAACGSLKTGSWEKRKWEGRRLNWLFLGMPSFFLFFSTPTKAAGKKSLFQLILVCVFWGRRRRRLSSSTFASSASWDF